jgi:hypothetical protein
MIENGSRYFAATRQLRVLKSLSFCLYADLWIALKISSAVAKSRCISSWAAAVACLSNASKLTTGLSEQELNYRVME